MSSAKASTASEAALMQSECRSRSPSARNLVIADTCEQSVRALAHALCGRGFVVKSCSDGRAFRCLVEQYEPILVVSELRLADGPSLKHLEWLKRERPDARVVVSTNHGSVATAVRCAKLKADGYLEKPVTAERILAVAHGEWPLDETLSAKPLSLNRAMWEYVNHAMELGGSISAGAELLGLDRRSLRRMLAKYAPPAGDAKAGDGK